MEISCSKCKYGRKHSYINTYYCDKKVFLLDEDEYYHYNCKHGELKELLCRNIKPPLKIKYNDIVTELDKIYFGIKLKSIDQIAKEILEMKEILYNYRKEGICHTCKKDYCEKHGLGYHGCNEWE